MSDFSFIDNIGWLKPFIIELNKYYKCSTSSTSTTSTTSTSDRIVMLFEDLLEEIDQENKVQLSADKSSTDTGDSKIFTNTKISFQDAIEFAIHNLNTIFRKDCFTILNEKHSWINCLNIDNYGKDTMCRVSRGFGNRLVPIGKKFNPIFHNIQYSNVVALANHSYSYLRYCVEIETILKTPSSDYTRFSINNEVDENMLNRFFIMNLRNIQKTNKNQGPFDDILATYESNVQNV
tara:strand:+ start:10792 stop:11496 length:705 start_codon:yes stop_codon:yes gene_type:complete